MAQFRCRMCDALFDVPQKALDKYPGWTPSTCRSCSPPKGARAAASSRPAGRGGGGRSPSAGPQRESLTLAQVLARYPNGRESGVFTDGSCRPNPGPGGWGVVWVEGGEIRAQRHGHDPSTTNNRMELTALIEALELLPTDARLDVFSDSELCVKTINEWAAGWAKNGWRRKRGEIKNIDLVQRLWALARSRPGAHLRWIRGHDGQRWNEYADALAMAWTRDSL